MISLMCFLTALLGISAIVAFYFTWFFQKRKLSESVSIQQKINFIKKITPVCYSKRWNIMGIDNGLRIWQKDVGSAILHWYSGSTVYGCSCRVPATIKDILNAMQDLRYISEWDPCVQDVSRVNISAGRDVVSGTPVVMGTIENLVMEILKIYGDDVSTIYTRHWNNNKNIDGWFFTSSMQQAFLPSGFLWCCVLVTPLSTENSEKSGCIVSMISAPTTYYTSTSDIKLFTSSRLAGLKDYFTNNSSIKVASVPIATPNGHVTESSSQNEVNDSDDRGTGEDDSDLTSNPADQDDQDDQDVVPDEEVISNGQENISLEDEIKQMQKVCMDAYNAKLGTEGWAFLSNVKDVEIIKKSAQSGEPPWETLKGVVVVNVPVHYALAYGFSLDYRGEWDDLFLRGEIVKEIDPLTKFLRVEFKAIWPTSGRDFVNIAALREIEDGLYCVSGASPNECPECPPKKGLVRGDLLCMGFFVKEISSDPPCCQITYVSRADLKGNLPPRLVNRVTQSQPQGLAILRDRLEALYNQDKEQGPDSESISDIQKLGVDLWIELMKIKEATESGSLRTADVKTTKKSPSTRRRLQKSKDSLDSQSTADEKSCMEDSLIKEEEAESMLEKSGPQVSEENMKLPFVDSHIDYKTLGNQAAAAVLGEVVMASKAEIGSSDTTNDHIKNKGEWSYQSIEKDVVILRKISPGDKIHSFLGKGLIKCSPNLVWDAVRNHMTRHVYDKMLKKTKLIREVDEHTKLEYLHFEADHCFLKQARDFLLLTSERIEPNRFTVAGVSVDAPECPSVEGLIRGKVYGSGWVIEPVKQDGRMYSMVSYLSQVDFGGVIPVRLLNYVARRQPLCIAYLREYLEKFTE